MISVNLNASNQEDWTIQFSAVTDDTGVAIDFSGATINFKLRDKNDCIEVTASTSDGSITQPTIGTLQILVSVAKMKTLCADSYKIGCVYALNGTTAQLFTGSADIYDGIATI